MNNNISPLDEGIEQPKSKRGRKPTEARLIKKEEKNIRDEIKNEILQLSRRLYKDNKITKSLHNKMFNISMGYARLDTLQNAYKSLLEVGNNEELVKKHQYNTLLKQKKQEHKERKLNREEVIDSKTYRFKFQPKPDEIARVFNNFYTTLDFKLPSNKDYPSWIDGSRKTTHNFMYSGAVGELDTLLYQVFNQQKYRFKINISFAFILIKESQGDKNYQVEFKFWDASTNTRIFKDTPATTIDNKKDMDNLLNRINIQNEIEKLTNLENGSQWKFYKFVYVRFDIYHMDAPIGAGNVILADHLKTGTNQQYLIKYDSLNDNLCFWRCLAYHIHKPSDRRRVETPLIKLFNEYYNGKADYKNYNGINYIPFDKDYDEEKYGQSTLGDELSRVEIFFKVNINVYNNDTSIIDDEKNETFIVELERRSMTNYTTTLNLMRYNNHFMYITDLEQIRKSFKCRCCSKFFKDATQVHRHEKNCKSTNYILNGGFYNAQENIFTRIFKEYKKSLRHTARGNYKIDYLKEFGLNESDLYYPNEIAFDFEARMEQVPVLDGRDAQLKFTNKHIPVSVSINSNVPGYDKAYFICNESPEILVDDFIKYIYNISLKAVEINTIKYKKIINFLQKHANPDEEHNDFNELLDKFMSWMIEIPVLSFNGAKYDINLMKNYLHKSLNDIGEYVSFAIKKANSYMSLKTQHFKFLDIRSYLAPNYSYDEWIKAYKCKLTKGYFPYDWLNSYEKLNNTELPSHEAFHNALKNKNITDEEYKTCVEAWNNNNMKTMKDYLEYYNNLDVIPFIEAVEQMKNFYQAKKLDIFKDGVSLPGLVLKYLMKSTDSKFSLFEQNDKDLYDMLKGGIVGGPSIIFSRHAEAGKTKIRGGNKLCKKVIGYDANALYLWAIAQDMPTGEYQRIDSYELEQFKEDILNDKLFGFMKVDIETPEHLKEYFNEMTPIFKNEVINFEDIGEYSQQQHIKNDIKFSKSKKLIGSYFGKEITLYTPNIKWYLQHGLIITKFHMGIEYTPVKCFQKFADEVSDARRAGDVDKLYELIAETMKLFGNSAYGKTITNKEGFVNTSYATEKNISNKINNPRFKDLEELYSNSYEITSAKRDIKLDLPLQIGCAVYQLAKLRMLEFYFDFIDKYVDRSDFCLIEMDTDSNYFAFSEDSIEKLIKPHMREEYNKEKYNFLPSESSELHPTFAVDGKRFTMKQYDKRKPGLFKIECIKDKMIALTSKMYCGSEMSETCNCCACKKMECKCPKKCSCNFKCSCKGIQKSNNEITYQRFKSVLFDGKKDMITNKGFRYLDNNHSMHTYTQEKKGLSAIYCKRKLCSDGINTVPLDI